MNTRFRVFFILLGALLVAATFTFPRWSHLLIRTGETTIADGFTGLAPEMQPTFEALSPDAQAAYQAQAALNPQTALRMVTAALQAPVEVPPEAQALPSMSGPVAVATGAFRRLDPIRWAEGDVTIYEQADGTRVLRFENFSAVNGPDLQVILSVSDAPASPADLRLNDTDITLGDLQGTLGAQNYDIPRDLDLSRYGSIVLYSRSLDMLYSIAPLTMS
jgi:hypothetical protein